MRRSKSDRTDNPRGRAAFDYRASRARVIRREDAGETVEACGGCGTELDVAAPAHEPRCAQYVGEGGPELDPELYTAQSGLRVQEIDRRFKERVLDVLELTVACSECPWSFTGTGKTAAVEQEKHIAKAHPSRVRRRRVDVAAEVKRNAVARAEAMWAGSDGSEAPAEGPPDA